MNNTLVIGHIADCHLCLRQYGSESRGNDFLKGLLNAIDALSKNGARLVLCAGDLLDVINPGAKVCLEQLYKVRRKLQDNGQLMLVIAGNHDNSFPHWCSGMKDSADDGGIYYIDGEVYSYNVEGCDVPFTVTGRSFLQAQEYREWMEGEAKSADVLMFHNEVLEAAHYPGESMLRLSEFGDAGKWNYIAAGHIHKRMVLTVTKKKNNPLNVDIPFVYPGSTELKDISEDAEKTACLVTFKCMGEKLGWYAENIDSVPFKTKPVQRMRIENDDDLLKACSDIIPGSIVYAEFDRKLKSLHIHRLLKNAAERKETEEGVSDKTIVRTEPILLESEKEVLSRIRTGKCMTLVEFAVSKAADSFSADEKGRGLDKLCVRLLDRNLDHRAEIDKYVTEQLDGKVLI